MENILARRNAFHSYSIYTPTTELVESIQPVLRCFRGRTVLYT